MGNRLNISLIIPVFNEENSITALVDSINNQVRLPDEIIFVDGGSTDNTVKMLEQLSGNGSKYKLVMAGRAMPGKGRNVGTAAATYNWIAYTDAGIVLDKNWLHELEESVKIAQGGVDIVYGNYRPQINTTFDKVAAITYVTPFKEGKIRGKSIASCLLKKEVWQKIEGFPDWRAAEDLVFMEKAASTGFKHIDSPSAIIFWKLSPNIHSSFKKFDMYTKYNVWAKRGKQWLLATVKQYLFMTVFLLLSIFHSWYWILGIPLFLMGRTAKRIFQNRAEFGLSPLWKIKEFISVLLLSIVIDFAVFTGYIKAVIQGSHDWRQKWRFHLLFL
jgi:glycosyltransferase involved in cell wall biosynthesis